MATQADVRRIALSLPGTEEVEGRFAFSIRNKGTLKGYAWVWMERTVPNKPRVPNKKVLAVRVASMRDRDVMIAVEPAKFFEATARRGLAVSGTSRTYGTAANEARSQAHQSQEALKVGSERVTSSSREAGS